MVGKQMQGEIQLIDAIRYSVACHVGCNAIFVKNFRTLSHKYQKLLSSFLSFFVGCTAFVS